MARKLYPIGIQTFERIRKEDKFYIDKTEYVYRMTHTDGTYFFLSRPRRFGKSLLVSTFQSYFEGKKELFKGLAIEKLEKEWNTYPVLHFDLSKGKHMEKAQLEEHLGYLLEDYEQKYGIENHRNGNNNRFNDLIEVVFQKTGKQVVVLIDEYDAPMMRYLYDEKMRESVRSLLRGFYQIIKSGAAYLRFVFITGVTKFSQLSIFSELNNLYQISLLDGYSGICGITQNELNTVLRPCVEEFAEALGISTSKAYALLKKNYDGYHFSPKGQDVYAPFSLLRALNDKTTNHYWFESGTSTALLEHLKRYPITRALDYDGVEVCENEFSIPCESADTPMPLLYQSGYLTIASYDPLLKLYVLKIPNNEVRKGLIDCLMPIILKRTVADNNGLVTAMAKAIFSRDLGKALTALRSYIAKIPYDIITKEEWECNESREAFYKLLIYMAFSMLNSIVDTEVKSVLGRADVVIQTNADIFVLELKVDDTAENALQQIDSKGYTIPYEADGRKLTKCGICISSSARNITHWRTTDADGNVVDEQKFNS